jgi:hypothetical protein
LAAFLIGSLGCLVLSIPAFFAVAATGEEIGLLHRLTAMMAGVLPPMLIGTLLSHESRQWFDLVCPRCGSKSNTPVGFWCQAVACPNCSHEWLRRMCRARVSATGPENG